MFKQRSSSSTYNYVIYETFRLFPLFGIAHRIMLDDICIDEKVIKKGTVVCFNYEKYHRTGFQQPHQFQPDRWKRCPMKTVNFTPFGVKENRMCPAQGIALMMIHVMLKDFLMKYQFLSTATQTRALPNRGPMLILKRNKLFPSSFLINFQLVIMKFQDLWENVFLSFRHLIYGSLILLEAKKLKLVQRDDN